MQPQTGNHHQVTIISQDSYKNCFQPLPQSEFSINDKEETPDSYSEQYAKDTRNEDLQVERTAGQQRPWAALEDGQQQTDLPVTHQ